MKRQLLLMLIVGCLMFTFIGCGKKEDILVNVENQESLHNTTIGVDSWVEIGDGLFYDSTTRIVWFRAHLGSYNVDYEPYIAPNGLPYKYNPDTNTLEEINITEYLRLEEDDKE